ncbi:MAG: hypothetical protein KGY45_02900 [Hadesarchaea archaeon]|nr:hypothetical protein [Hadesarchaea archaeon]
MREEHETVIRFEVILGISGIITLLGSLAPWMSAGPITGNALHLWQGNLAFIGSWVVILGSIMKYGALNVEEIEKLSPYVDGGLGMIGSILVLISVFASPFGMSPGTNLAWGVYLTGLFAIIALFAGYMVYEEGSSSIPKGLSDQGIIP